jgi:hypothetical protein
VLLGVETAFWNTGMSEHAIAAIASIAIYKLASLATGTALAYMGYRLFMAGMWGKAGDVDIQFKENKLLIRKAAPSTFFTVAGALVIALTLFKGLGFK